MTIADSITQSILDAVDAALPAQVGDRLKARLNQLADLEQKLAEAARGVAKAQAENESSKKLIASLRAEVSAHNELHRRERAVAAREREVQDAEREVQDAKIRQEVAMLTVKLAAAEQSKQDIYKLTTLVFSSTVARETMYKSSSNHNGGGSNDHVTRETTVGGAGL